MIKAIKKEFEIAIKLSIKKMSDEEFLEFMNRVMKVIEEMKNEKR